MSEFAPTIASQGGGLGTTNGNINSGLNHNAETPTIVKQGEVVFQANPETKRGQNEPVTLDGYDNEKVAEGLLKDVGTYGFKGGLERLAEGKTGQDEDIESKEPDGEKDEDTKKEIPEDKTVQEIEKLKEQVARLEAENKILHEQQEQTELKLQKTQENVNDAASEIKTLEARVKKLEDEVEVKKKKKKGISILETLGIITLSLFGEAAKVAEDETTEKPA